ncbi:hypothetical protein EDB81DRAFT_611081, partial [Dactylonectria macrodidyma]
AIHSQETAGGEDFLQEQGRVYEDVFKTYFRSECQCKRPLVIPEQTHSLQERSQFLQCSLPPLSDVFGGGDGTFDPRASFHQWQNLLSNRPSEPLSFCKTQASLPDESITITRQWDIDSIWLGAKDLSAIQDPGGFYLSFMPPHKRNLSTDQVIQPHGLDLAHTRHIHIGSFTTASTRFSVLLFFPRTAAGKKTSASSNSLSLDRQRDLYDEIILPAAYETLPDHARQEIPSSYDLVYAKSRSYQEKPGSSRWCAEDESRAFHLSYHIPRESLAAFWASVVRRANACTVTTRRGEAFPYFENPRLLFQSHDLKNVFARPSLHESMTLLRDMVLISLDPAQLDMHSCWLDIGNRDWVQQPPRSEPDQGSQEPWTLLWKSRCHERLHEELAAIAPNAASLRPTQFQTCLLRDIGTYTAKAKPTRTANAGHPEARAPGIIRAKAYNCYKELFGVMYSDYQLFGSSFLPLLAFDQGMIQDLSSASQGRDRASVNQLNRNSIARAWEANKRHLRAISEARVPANYGIRKEVTFRLDAVLAMWGNGAFDPARSPHTARLSRVVPLRPGEGAEGGRPHHYPFWAVPTRVINTLVATQAARFVLPLDHIFREAASLPAAATKNHRGQPGPSTSSPIQQVLGFYTAQLLCRLLTYSLTSETEYSFDNWIWLSRWTVKAKPPMKGAGRAVRKERRGLGLRAPLDATGMLWIPSGHVNWQQGHLSIQVLLDLYIPRSPLQAKLAHQSSLQAFTTSQVTVEYLLKTWLGEARQRLDQGQRDQGIDLMQNALELAVEEVARAYHQHLLAKLASYWSRARDQVGRQRLGDLIPLQKAQEGCVAQPARIVTARTIWEIYCEAWAMYTQVVGQENGTAAEETLPPELPCWMSTRRHKPPKNSWCDFVFDQLFHRPTPPTWKNNHFLQLYETYKGIWETVQDYAKPFDYYFSPQIGRYIMVAFNSDKTKEVGTRHGEDTWHHSKPAFFQIQYWAPYFSPPEHQRPTLGSAFPRPQYHQGLCSTSVAQTLNSQSVEGLDLELQNEWVELVLLRDTAESSAEKKRVVTRCKRALWCMGRLLGPSWGNDSEVAYMIPWELERISERVYGDPDHLRLPVPHSHIPASKQRDVVSLPTIILPTWRNIRDLVAVMATITYLTDKVKKRRKILKQRAFNRGYEFDLPDFLITRCNATDTMPEADGVSALREFLTQTEPPQWDV